jgi:hypothetical protein
MPDPSVLCVDREYEVRFIRRRMYDLRRGFVRVEVVIVNECGYL